MTNRVVIEPDALEEMEAAYLYIAEDSPTQAARWFNGLLDAVARLEDMPRRCPLALENDAFEFEVRQLVHGNYRVLFTVADDAVHVMHVRHAARRPLGHGGGPDENDAPDSSAGR